MTLYPRELAQSDIAPELSSLVRKLAALMLDGPTPQHRILREQLTAARVSNVTLTGAGLFATFEHSPDTTTVTPPDLIGGQVSMKVQTLDAPAGSLLKVSGGLLDFVEIYTFGEVGWPDEPQVLEFSEATPLPIPV